MKPCNNCEYCHEHKSIIDEVRSYWCSLYQNMLLRLNYDNNRPEKCHIEKLSINEVFDCTL